MSYIILQFGKYFKSESLSYCQLQDPVLFTDTVRKNLDPFNQHTDEALWMALDEASIQSTHSGAQLQAHIVAHMHFSLTSMFPAGAAEGCGGGAAWEARDSSG